MEPAFYFRIMGIYRHRIFLSHADYQACAQVLLKHLRGHRMHLRHYCFLPNQIHLLIHLREGMTAKIFEAIQVGYAAYFKQANKVSRRVFERHNSVIRVPEAQLPSYGLMIENLPYWNGLVGADEIYPHASLGHYAGKTKDLLVSPSPVSSRILKALRMPDELYSLLSIRRI